MSSTLLPIAHLNTIISSAAALGLEPVIAEGAFYDLTEPDDQQLLVRMFHAENLRAINHRYEESHDLGAVSSIRYESVVPLDAFGLLLAMQGLEYQCLEHDAWETTREYCILTQLMQQVAELLLGEGATVEQALALPNFYEQPYFYISTRAASLA